MVFFLKIQYTRMTLNNLGVCYRWKRVVDGGCLGGHGEEGGNTQCHPGWCSLKWELSEPFFMM